MLEKALVGDRKYWVWIGALLTVMGIGFLFYIKQFTYGLGVTGLSRDLTWGLYIAQFTFMVGVAASGVMVVLPYYLHNYKAFGKMAILGEFLAIASIMMCGAFIIVDMGVPFRMTNMFIFPSPRSPMFWDAVSLGGYMLLNIIAVTVTLGAVRKGAPPPKWVKPVIYLSIPWAISIHTVTAFLYSGLVARPFWMTAIMAPRFLATAFSSGPALLILLAFILRQVANYDVGKKAISKLSEIVTYAMCVNVFFLLVELFTALYSNIPEHTKHFELMFFGLEGNMRLVPWMWTAMSLSIVALLLLINPSTRKNESTLTLACIAIFAAVWIEKGMVMIVTGFIPSPLGKVVDYWPTLTEAMISVAIWAMGIFVVTIFYKVAVAIRK